MSTVVVIGDVGGHPDELGRALASVGMVGGRLPADVIVVQVGDLVDRGPDSRSVVRMVAHYLSEQPQQWVQLIGNHETQYLPGHERFWPDSLGDDAGLLISWWERGS